jgi:hypothetical protein
MSTEPAELIVGGFRAFNQGGPETFIDYLTGMDAIDSDFVMEIQEDAPNGGQWQGVAGFQQMSRIWLEAWKEFEILPGEPIEMAADRYLAPVRQRVIARGSGMELEEDFFYTFELSEGRFKRVGLFMERSLAERHLGVAGDGA